MTHGVSMFLRILWYIYIPKTNTAELIPPCLLGLQDLPLQSTEISWAMGSPLNFFLDSISIQYHYHLLSSSCFCTYSNPPSNQWRKYFRSVVNWTKLCLIFIIDIYGSRNKDECKELTGKEIRKTFVYKASWRLVQITVIWSEFAVLLTFECVLKKEGTIIWSPTKLCGNWHFIISNHELMSLDRVYLPSSNYCLCKHLCNPKFKWFF